MEYSVIETFTSIDGEGVSSGELAVFIRFAGCNLQCAWCDTRYSWDQTAKPTSMTAYEIRDFVEKSGAINVTLTGGEPLIQSEIGELIELLIANKKLIVRIETNGSVDIRFWKRRFKAFGSRVQFVVDYKMPSSGMYDKMHRANLHLIDCYDVFKFVIASQKDLETAIDIVNYSSLHERCHVYFSPVVDELEPKRIVERMVEKKLNGVKVQLQLHKYIWSKEMRGV